MSASNSRARAPKRRTQAERRAGTHARILDGTIRFINDAGVANLTVAQLVEHTGVSWGSMQNLFGTKDNVLVEICETAIGMMTGRLAALACERRCSLEDRIRLLIKYTREIFATPVFSAASEIFRNPPQDKAARRRLHLALRTGRTNMDKAWRHVFEGTKVDNERLVFARHLVNMGVSGLNANHGVHDPIAYEWQIPFDSFADKAIEFLIENIVRSLETPTTAGAKTDQNGRAGKARGRTPRLA